MPTPLGWKVSSFIDAHFEKSTWQEGRGNRWYYQCKLCPSSQFLHRGNNLLEHLASTDLCPDASSGLRLSALNEIAKKLRAASSTSEFEDTDQGDIKMIKKCEINANISKYIDHTLSDGEINTIHLKLVRYVIWFMERNSYLILWTVFWYMAMLHSMQSRVLFFKNLPNHCIHFIHCQLALSCLVGYSQQKLHKSHYTTWNDSSLTNLWL